VRRIIESATASVVGGLILWSLTGSMSRSSAAPDIPPIIAPPAIHASTPPTLSDIPKTTLPDIQKATLPVEARPEPLPLTVAQPIASNSDAANRSATATLTPIETPAPQPAATLSIPAAVPTASPAAPPVAPKPTPKRSPVPYAATVNPILLYENFSRFRDGDSSAWGLNTQIKTGLDHRNWLMSNVDGVHPVGARLALPNDFSFECRYSAYTPEVTRGVLGWWKEPVATRISFVNEQGVKYSVDWAVRCGNDIMRLNPLGSSSLYAKRYYHAVKLPDGTTNELGVAQPTGMIRIDRSGDTVKVFLDGQSVVVGTMGPMGQLVGFEINIVKSANGAMAFTDFKIGR
jgi:hypothetical protein